MTFLVGILLFTFTFVFLSFFRTYFYFNFAPYYRVDVGLSFKDLMDYFRDPSVAIEFFEAYDKITLFISSFLIEKKREHMEFYKRDIKSAMGDQVTHAPLLEFLWVVFPALILVAIAYPSVVMLYYNETYVEPVFNITVVGNQWFWTYEYNDFNLLSIFKRHVISDQSVVFRAIDDAALSILHFNGRVSSKLGETYTGFHEFFQRDSEILKDLPRRFTVDCNMIIAKDPKFLRLLSTDHCLVIPAKTPIRLLITSADVIHSWAVPSYGVKLDAVPGRINQQLLTVPLMGTSWGQCSELCGVNHAYMPIEIKVLHFADFLYFMHLRVKEILLPYLVAIYDNRLNLILDFLHQVKPTMLKNPENFEQLSKIGQLHKIMALQNKIKL
jgi:cytochrome c oxidase subunit 2